MGAAAKSTQKVAGKAAGNGNGKVKEAKLLSRDQILGAKDLVEEIVEIPEWGGAVKIRSFSKAVQHELRERATQGDEIDLHKLEVYTVLEAVIEPQFTADDFEALKAKSSGAIDRILQRVYAITGQRREDVEAAEAEFRDES